MTMSTSSAPAATAARVSASLTSRKDWPEGKAVATLGMEGSAGCGRTAFEQRAATFPGVSAPSSVVRSIQRMARSSAHSLDDFLIERLLSAAARSSAPTWSTVRTPRISEPRWASETAVAMSFDYPPGRDGARLRRAGWLAADRLEAVLAVDRPA